MSTAAARDAELGDIDWTVLPEGAVRDTVAAPSGALARIALGPVDGPRIVLVPGAIGSKEDFVRMLPLLAAAGYRAEAYDLAGHYESAAAGPERLEPPQAHATLDLFAADLAAVLRAGATPAHVLGYSYAGTIATEVAAREPELVASLVLLSSAPKTGAALRGFRILGPVSGLIPARWAAGIMIWGAVSNVNHSPAGRAAFVKLRQERTRRAIIDDIFVAMRDTPDRVARLRETGVPVLVACGRGDVWPMWRHRRYAARLGARLAVLTTGHNPCETTPYQLTEVLVGFVAAVGGTSPVIE
jgi:pimeloyl-ACP methyl ester carboxylesterase